MSVEEDKHLSNSEVQQLIKWGYDVSNLNRHGRSLPLRTLTLDASLYLYINTFLMFNMRQWHGRSHFR